MEDRLLNDLFNLNAVYLSDVDELPNEWLDIWWAEYSCYEG